MLKNSLDTYGSIAKLFHWVISVLIIFMLVFGYFLDDFPKDIQDTVYNIHKLIGLTILSLMLLRLAWRLMNPKPILPARTARWEHLAEHSVHYLFYMAVVCMTLLGWVGSVALGYVPYLGNFEFKLPIEKNKELGDLAFTWHGYFAIVLIVLISIHALAAFYHHFVRKDNVLKRMLF